MKATYTDNTLYEWFDDRWSTASETWSCSTQKCEMPECTDESIDEAVVGSSLSAGARATRNRQLTALPPRINGHREAQATESLSMRSFKACSNSQKHRRNLGDPPAAGHTPCRRA